MSKLRSVNTHFWQDNYIIDLDPIEKLIFLYLLTNEQTNMLGIYELHIRRISFDTGIDKDMVLKVFDRFEEKGKAKYLDGYVILRNFIKHQSYNTNMQTSAINTWNELPLNILKDSFCKPIAKGLEAFGKPLKPIGKIEVELEYEYEEEEEGEPSSSAKVNVSEESLSVAEYLLDSICEFDKAHRYNRTKPNIETWALDIDRAIRIDGRTEEQLKFIIEFLFTQKNPVASFWSSNIQSGKKLREKFDTIKNQIKTEKLKSQGYYGNNKTKGDRHIEFLSRS